MKIEDAEKYIEGIGCRCAAWNGGECGCDADWTPKMEHVVKAWNEMSPRELHEHFGEILSDREIQVIRAVLYSMLKSNAYKPTFQEIHEQDLKWDMEHLNDEQSDFNNGLDIS